jgi:hypothetical protein
LIPMEDKIYNSLLVDFSVAVSWSMNMDYFFSSKKSDISESSYRSSISWYYPANALSNVYLFQVRKDPPG